MENKLEIFKNEEFGEVMVLEENGKQLFEASAVARALGYTNPQKAIRDHCKKAGVSIRSVGVQTGVKKDGTPAVQNINKNFIDEGNIYRLITHSKLPSAEKFESWVFDEVLPSIRNHGAYLTDNKIEELLTNPDTIIKLATDLKLEREEKKKLEIKNKQNQQLIGELKPKADYTDRILQSKSLVTITAISKDYGMSGQEMNKKLHELGVQYNLSGQWLLYAKYQDKGYTHSETIEYKHKTTGLVDTKMNTKWTQKGRLFLYNLLKENGLLPMVEREA